MAIENVEPLREIAKPDPQTTAKLHDEAVNYVLARGGGFPHPGGGGFPHPGGGLPFPHPGGGQPFPHPGGGGYYPQDHGFHPGHNGWGPPMYQHWGWHDEARWARGWDTWFWLQSPNYSDWNNNINGEAASVAFQLDTGNAQGAAVELREDLYALRGDMYAQDQLLDEVNRFENKGMGADLYLGNWDSGRGTWDNIQIYQPGYDSIPINSYDGYSDQYPVATGGMVMS